MFCMCFVCLCVRARVSFFVSVCLVGVLDIACVTSVHTVLHH